ncbi:hypothetical protein Plhal710r2_c046g0148921 [Plasmopara halstedii]
MVLQRLALKVCSINLIKNFLDRDPVIIISLNDIEFSSLLAQNKMPILKQYFLPKLIQLYC